VSEEHVNIEPIERSPIPVGSVAEAEAENLDPAVYATCSRPNPTSGNVGCAWYHKCKVSAKGQSGPRNYGVEIIKGKHQGGGFLKAAANCMWIADRYENYVRNGGALKVIAEEGQEFERVSGVLVNKLTGEPTVQGDMNAKRRVMRVKEKVQPYPRPGDNMALLTDILRAESIEAEKEQRDNDARAEAYGLGHTIPPIDQRSAGKDGGRKAAGGGGSKG
jgi:hypothetical protein